MKPKRIGLAQSSKPPIIEYHDGHWRVWTAYDPTLTLGTFFKLYSDGSVNMITVNPDLTHTFTRM